ncbi:MAG TPA: ROK family protein, partial [Bacteroidales bacterium]|nr:ROK family protein [Bacteroidales bacterium]
MDYPKDKRIIMTLDAGGTNFVFSAMQGGKEIIAPVTQPANGDNLALCLQSITKGFEDVQKQLNEQPAAISFAFPGPADYRTGIIGDLANLPGFRGGVPLGPMLEEQFHMPVFINNDGDLYAYGEALGGILPEINNRLEATGSTKRYHNLIGLTLGTGFGGGIVHNEELFTVDNSNAAEVWIFSNRQNPDWFAEEGISARAVNNKYAQLNGENTTSLKPVDIYEIATGKKSGNKEAALEAFRTLGRYLGDTLANLLTLMDGIAVIGGGLTGAAALYMPAV